LRGESLVEPQQNGPNPGIKVTQPLDKLHRKGSVQRFAFEASQHGRWRYRPGPTGAQKAVRNPVRFLSHGSAPHDSFGNAAKIFYEHHP
jgi:hypothetical protein